MPDEHPRPAALDRLEPLIGAWTVEPDFPPEWDAPKATGEVVFEWVLDRQYVLIRSEAPDPVPDSLSVISYDAERDGLTQHYFDSRGVTRLYEMTFDGTMWTLTREKADFSPLDFSQRFVGTVEEGGSVIRGTWEACHDGTTWEKDFDLVYRKT